MFGGSLTPITTGFTPSTSETASFGVPLSYSGSGVTTHSSLTGGAAQMNTIGANSEKSARKILGPQQSRASASKGSKALSGRTNQVSPTNPSEESATSSTSEASGLQTARTSLSSLSGSGGSGGGQSGGASSAAAFPDSTKQTAILSPPDSDDSPFASPPDGLSYSFPDLNNMQFLRLALRTGVASGKAKQEEDPYQRFLDRVSAKRSSTTPPGVTTGLTPSSLPSSSPLGSQFGYKSGIKPSDSYGLGTGLQNSTSNPFTPNPY
jgi:hypothetical protein